MRFFRNGLLAIQPAAFSIDFMLASGAPLVEERGGVAIVTVRGPTVHHEEGFFDSYDGIKARVACALAGASRAVLLSIDSPGGLVSGCFDTVREIRALAEAAGKPVYAYVDGMTCSAGYALACAADRIFVPETGQVGSIGILEGVVDQTKLDEQMGIAFTFVTSGARKIDGNPHAAVTDESLAAIQENVNETAERFYALVAERRGLEADAVRALEAGVFVGKRAIELGLADELATEDQAVARIAQLAKAADTSVAAERTMGKLAEIKKQLKALAESDGDEAQEARRMLGDSDSTEDKDGDKDKDSGQSDKDDKQAAAAGGKNDDDDNQTHSGDGQASATTSREPGQQLDVKTLSRVSSMERELAALKAEKAAEKRAAEEATERQNLFASRPDLSSDMVAYLASSPIEEVRRACQPADKGGLALGPGRDSANPLAAAAQPNVRPTLGQHQGRTDMSSVRNLIQPGESDKEIMDRKMGIRRGDPSKAIRSEGNFRVYGCLTPDDARRLAAQREQVGGMS